ncbi:hypothetical protein BDW42DRAFT_187589 [Aspergillus taichungensis]|uniref:Uncharacterized protein n=1 Tax=Aspergillus taichungensis TaxID=482145 RepID=A0A2J5HMF4_9EURO|nr:hypothetical protein BDW42DRAFT_187589 [Aspergillus taichungensis]
MPRNIVREQLDHLWDVIVQNPEINISTEPDHLNDIASAELNAVNIILPFFFCPLPAQVLADNPIDLSCYRNSQQEDEQELKFPEFNPPPDKIGSRISLCCPESTGIVVSRYVNNWALGFSRPGLGVERMINDSDYMRHLSMPNPLLLGADGAQTYGNFPRGPNAVFPHSTVCPTQNFFARDRIILYSELATIIAAMRNGAKQPKVDPNAEDTQEALFKESEEFPVLILSYVGPQHARLLYACMDRRQLVIRLSRLYSFERTDTASLDLFARVLLNRPLTEWNPAWKSLGNFSPYSNSLVCFPKHISFLLHSHPISPA